MTKDELTKAFGGCTKCYGKGYGTQTMFARGSGESDIGQGHISIDQKLPSLVFCVCDRAKDLEKQFIKNTNRAKREVLQDFYDVINKYDPALSEKIKELMVNLQLIK